jgi:DNA-binding NtrC family response regulator
MATGPVLVVDDDEDLRQALGDVLVEILDLGWIGAGSFDELVGLGDRALACDVAILDVNLGAGRPSGLDVLEWLKRRGFRGRIVFLTGHARSDPLVAEAWNESTVRVYQKPMTLEQLGAIVDDKSP